MTKYRPSKSFLLAMLGLCPLLVGSGYFLHRISHAPKPRPMMYDGPIRMVVVGDLPPPPVRGKIGQAIDAIKQWEHNPWKPSGKASAEPAPTVGTGDHFFDMEKSIAPKDQARCRELYRLSDIWMKKLLVRHADMAIPSKSVPDDQNGYLKLLELTERFKKPDSHDYRRLEIPKELTEFIHEKNSWPAEVAKTWLTQQKPLLDEIRAIGLMPDQSDQGITLQRHSFKSGGLTKNLAEALLLDARLAAGEGDVQRALDSTRAANGIADHLEQIETPCFYSATVSTLIRLSISGIVFSEIMPALPAGEIDPAAWEAALHPTVAGPAEYGRLLKGEYHSGMRVFVLPILADAGEPHPLPDPEEFIDVYTEMFRRSINANSSHDPKDLPHFKFAPPPSSAGLSTESRKFYKPTTLYSEAWQKGWIRGQSIHGMHQAAFAIMKGQSVPTDPIYGLPYVWDSSSRTLSAPVSPTFDDMKIKSIVVPKP